MKKIISWALTVMMIIGMLGSFSPLSAFAAVSTTNPIAITQWHDDTGVIKDGFGVLVPSATTTATVEFVWQNAYYTATVGTNAFKTVADAIAAGKTQLIVPALTYTDISITGPIELYGNHYGVNPNSVPVDRTKDWAKNTAWNEYVTTVSGNITVTSAAAPKSAAGTNIVINGLRLDGLFVDNTRPVSKYSTKIKMSNIFFNFSKAVDATHHVIDLETVHARTDSDSVLNVDSFIVENSRFEFPTSNGNSRVFDEDCPQTVIVKNNYFAASHPRLGWFKQRACIKEGYLEVSDNYFKQSGYIIHLCGGFSYFDNKNVKANSVAKFNGNVVYNPTVTDALQLSPGEFKSTEVCGNVFIDTTTMHKPVLSVVAYDETFKGENYKDSITFKGNRFIGVADYLTLNDGTTKLDFDNANYYDVYSDNFVHGQVDGKMYGVLGQSDYYLDFNATVLASEAAMARGLEGMAVSADANTASVIIPANTTYTPALKTISGVNFTLYTDSEFINAVSSINASEVVGGKLYYARAITPSRVKIDYKVYISSGNPTAPKYEGAYLLYDKCQQMPVGTKFSANYKGQEYMFTAGVDAFSSLAQISVAHRKQEKINVIMLSGNYEGGYNVTGDFNIVGDNTVLKNDFKTSGPVKIACIGDSITEAVIDGGRATLGYPARLNEYLNTTYGAGKYEVKNFGKGNSSLQQINTTVTTNMLTASRSQYTQGSWYYSALNYNPDVVMIMIGHNDTQLALTDHIYKSAANYEKYYVELIESFKALPSNPQVIIVSCHSRSDAFRKGILENSIIPVQKELAKRYNTIFVDNYSVSDTIKDGWASTPEGIYSADNLHLSPKGYKLLAQSIAENTNGIYSAVRSVTKTGITINSSASVAAAATKIKIACIGDDLTYGTKSYTNYPTVLGDLLGEGYEVRNYGECGSTPATYYADDGYGDISDYQSALAWKPNYAIINFGVNNATADSAFTTNLTNIVNAFKNAGTKVYLSTSIRTDANSGVWTVSTNTGVSVVDLNSYVFTKLAADCKQDTNVLNEKGHQKLGEFVYYWLFGKDFASTYTDKYGQIKRSAVVVDTTIPTSTASGSKYMYSWDGKYYNFYYGKNVFSSVSSAMNAVSGSSIQFIIPASDTAQAFTVDNAASVAAKQNVEVFGVNRNINPNLKTSTNPLDDWTENPEWGKNGESRVGTITIASTGNNSLWGNIKFNGITMCGGYVDTARTDGTAAKPLDLTATFENVVVDYQNGASLFNLNTTNRRTATDNFNDALVVKNLRVRRLTMSETNASNRRIMATGSGLSPAHISFDGFYIKDNTNVGLFGWQHAPNGNTNTSFVFKNSYVYGMGGFDIASSSVANRETEVATAEFDGNVFMNTTGTFALELHSKFLTKVKVENNYFIPSGTTLPIAPRNDTGLNQVTSLGYSLKNNTIIASDLKTVLDNARLNTATTGLDISGSYVSTSLNGLALDAKTITTGYVSNGYALDITRSAKTSDFNVNSVSFANDVTNLVIDNENNKITATVNYGQLIKNPTAVCSGDNVIATFKDEFGNPMTDILFERDNTYPMTLELSKEGKVFKTYTVTFTVTPAPLWTSRDDSEHIIKNDAVAVIAEAGKKSTNSSVSALFDGKYYRFIVGVNAFATLEAALATTAKQVIVPKGDLTKFEVTRSVEIYGVNYNVKPWIVEGEDVVQNPEWNEDGESAIFKTNLVITSSATPKDATGTTIVVAGFRLTQGITDTARTKSNYKTSITLKNNILDRHILTGDSTREFNFYNANSANTGDASVTNIDELTIENMFLVNRNPHTGHALMQEFVPAYFTVDGLACNQDTPALGFPKWGVGVKQGKMTLKNCYFRHHKDYSSRFASHSYFSGYHKSCNISDAEIAKRDLKLEVSNNTFIDCYDGGTEGVIKIYPAAFTDINIDGNTMVASTDLNNRAIIWGDGSADGYIYNDKDFTDRITFKNNRIIGYLPTHFVNPLTQIDLDENYYATFMLSYRNGVSGDMPADIDADYYLDFNRTTKLSDMAPTDSSSIASVKTIGKTRTIYGYASQNVNLSLSSDKGVNYTFYSDENCTKPISSLSVSLGNASKAYARATRNNITVVYTLYVMGVKNVTDVTSATLNTSLSGIGAPTLWYPSLYGASNGIEVVSYFKGKPIKLVTGQSVASSVAEMGLYGDDIIFPDNITDISGIQLVTAVNIHSASANIKSITTRKAKIACVGDSITDGVVNGNRDNSYPTKMQSVLGTTCYEVQNYGGSGATVQYLEYLRLNANAGDRERQYRILRKSMYDGSIAYNGDVVIIGLGTNDAAIDEPERWSSNYAYIDEYVKLIREYQALSSKPAIYITTATPRYDSARASMMVQDNLRYIQKAVADITGAKVIDLNSLADYLFSATGTTYSDDKLHPNASGYAQMGTIIANQLKNTFAPVSGTISFNGGKIVGTIESGIANTKLAIYNSTLMLGSSVIKNTNLTGITLHDAVAVKNNKVVSSFTASELVVNGGNTKIDLSVADTTKTYSATPSITVSNDDPIALLKALQVANAGMTGVCDGIDWALTVNADTLSAEEARTAVTAIRTGGHILVNMPGKDADCYNEGYTAYKACEHCDYTEGKTVIGTIAHETSKIEAKDSTALELGYKEHYKCIHCGDYFEDAAATKPIDDIVLWRAGVGSIACKKVYNETTGVSYENINDALMAAAPGDKVVLMSDDSTNYAIVTAGVTLDLNGNALTANYVVGFNGSNIVDYSEAKTGKLVAQQGTVKLAKDNDQLSIYDAQNGCYVFTTIQTNVYGKNRYKYTADTNKYTTSPFFFAQGNANERDVAHAILGSDFATSGVEVKIRITWEDNNGTFVSDQDFKYTAESVQKYIGTYGTSASSGNEKYDTFYAVFSNAILTQGKNAKIYTVVTSDTGAEFISGETTIS